MDSRYNNFIGIYDNVFADGFCKHVIDEFDALEAEGLCGTRKQVEGVNKTFKDDAFYFVNGTHHELKNFNDQSPKKIFYQGLQDCFEAYSSEYDILKNLDITCNNIKIQKTRPGGGYHVWHCEQGNKDQGRRVIVYALYLNTIDSAGETEFLYQGLRIPPKENTMVLWPAAYTHTHRGNVVYGNTPKYIITGWFYLE